MRYGFRAADQKRSVKMDTFKLYAVGGGCCIQALGDEPYSRCFCLLLFGTVVTLPALPFSSLLRLTRIPIVLLHDNFTLDSELHGP